MPEAEENRAKVESSSSSVSSCRFWAPSTLGAKTRSSFCSVERLEHAVVECPGGVDHRAQGVLGGDLGEELLQRLAIGHVTGGDLGLCAELAQLFCELLRSFCLGAAAAKSNRWRAPWCSARWRAIRPPMPPVPPLIRTVRSGSIGGVLSSPSSSLFCCLGAGQARRQRHPLAQGKLGLLCAQGEGGIQRLPRGLAAVGVDQREAAGVL